LRTGERLLEDFLEERKKNEEERKKREGEKKTNESPEAPSKAAGEEPPMTGAPLLSPERPPPAQKMTEDGVNDQRIVHHL